MKQFVLTAIAFAAIHAASSLPVQARPAKPAPPAPTWVFDIHHNADGNPRGKVFLRVHGKLVVVSPRAAGDYSVVTKSEYSDHHVPANAVAACSGWWAGGGEEIYVIRRRRRLLVFQRDIDEQSDAPAYHVVKRIAMRS